MLYGLLASVWFLCGITKGSVSRWVIWPTALLAIASACYSAFLFAQAKGRDLWQSPLFLWHLLVQAIAAGAATLIVTGAVLGVSSSLMDVLAKLLAMALFLSCAMIFGEISVTHGSEDLKRATDLLKNGVLSKKFWLLVVGLGICLPLILLLWPAGSVMIYVSASLFALLGLWTFEDLWVKAGQAVPLS